MAPAVTESEDCVELTILYSVQVDAPVTTVVKPDVAQLLPPPRKAAIRKSLGLLVVIDAAILVPLDVNGSAPLLS